MKRPLLAAAVVALVATFTPGAARASSAQSSPAGPPPVKHVFILILENEGADASFGADPGSPYLGVDLRAQGNLLEQYYGTGHNSLDNYLTMISGQPPVPLTQADCPNPGWNLCTYPAGVPTIAGQLDAAGLTWRGYMEDMASPCEHPGLGPTDADGTESATAASQYANRHNPFIYFHSIIDDAASCTNHVVNLDQLPTDLASADTTPSYTFITPDLCHDGHDAGCADGGPGGFAGIDAFLRQWVPLIEQSPAFADGLLLITFDEADLSSDSSACCYSTPLAGITGDGGGRVGMLAISPFIAPGTTTTVPYNHYSMLASVEDIFGLGHLGGAAQPASVPFGPDVYNAGAARGASGSGTAVNGGTSTTGALPTTGADGWPWVALAVLLVAGALGTRRVMRGR